MMKILIIWLSCLFMVTGVCASELEIISLRHRSADQLIPIIQPLLDKDEVVTGMNDQLILRASPRTIAQIKRLLDEIDTVPRSLNITVMQDVDSETLARLTEVSGSTGRTVRLTLPGAAGGGLGRDTLTARIISTRSLEDDKKTQHIRVLEGSRALISGGQRMPVPERQVVQTPWGTQVVETTRYRDVASGFYVLPRLNGEQVTLEISTQNDSLAPNTNQVNPDSMQTTRIQNSSSIVSGRLGEWISLGGLGQQSNTDNSTISSRSSSRLDEQRTILIKVEEVN